ncbi:NmrA family protein [Parafrankia sp. EUN1f]|nr:NmrA family protein [Parafrankia sp. EUN1f]
MTRSVGLFDRLGIFDADVVAADYADLDSLQRAVSGADAIFYSPASVDRDSALRQSEHVIAAAQSSGAGVVVLNSKMWAPDRPCGEPRYDLVLEIENLFAGAGLPVVTFRPVLFMDNLLTRFAKPALALEGVYRYCQRPDMRADWMSMDDLAKFMVAALDRPDLHGKRICLGGPQTLGIDEILAVLSRVMGKPLRYEYVTPYEFGLLAHAALGYDERDRPKAVSAAFFDSFYSFNNNSPHQPFRVDVASVLREIPISMETFEEWAERQDWTFDPSAEPLAGSRAG